MAIAMMALDDFQPCLWFANGHLQTWAGALIPRVRQVTALEQVPLPDGEILELHEFAASKSNAPILFLLHGLEGSVHSPYIQGMLRLAKDNNWRGVVPHLRGHNGRVHTSNLEIALRHVRYRYPDAPVVAIGYSLGANLLLKYLGEFPEHNLLTTAVGVCVPFDLEVTADKLSHGFNKIYEQSFLESLKKKFSNHEVDLEGIKTMRDFDEQITAQVYDFLDAKDYYQQSSCKKFLPYIQTPTLIINAQDDPIIPKEVIPTLKQVSKHVKLDIQRYGGHVGFISCKNVGKIQYWLEERISNYLATYF